VVTVDRVEDLLKQLAPQVLGAVVRRYGNFDSAEDATQEALIAASTKWPIDGVPNNPKAWLITVASRRLTDTLRSRQARQQRRQRVQQWTLDPIERQDTTAQGSGDVDDTLIVLVMCCYPALSTASQIALTLRAVGGLTTGEVARALLVSEATVTRRITRAKQTIRDEGTAFTIPKLVELNTRLAAVLHVLYLMFNEGYATTGGPTLVHTELSNEAIRLARTLHTLRPDNSELSGLLALMLLIDARRTARIGASGELVTLADQNRGLWNQAFIAEGIELITAALPRGPVGPYQLQAAIAAIHDEAATYDDTDWPQIVALYELLIATGDNPMIRLNHAVAVAMASGPVAGLELVARIAGDEHLTSDHRLHAVTAQLHKMAGNVESARTEYQVAIAKTTNLQQRRHLQRKLAQLAL
jgi:RNA polymerase sigma factor (sigma-70 family)